MTCLVFLTAWFEIIACLLCILLYLCDVAFELLLQLVQQYLFIPRSVTAFPSVPKIHAFLLYLKLENSLPEPKLPKLLETPADLHVFCYSFVVQTFCVFFFYQSILFQHITTLISVLTLCVVFWVSVYISVSDGCVSEVC